MLGSLKDDKLWKVFIIDDYTLKLLYYVAGVSDIKDHGISLIEQISLKRQPFPQMSAVYFLAPSDDSVRRLIEDFKDQRLYKSVHLFFTSKVPEKMFSKIKESNLVKKKFIRSFVELNFDFYTCEPNLFSFEQERDFELLFAKPSKKFQNKVVSKLASVFITAKQMPFIRYFGKSEVGKNVATALYENLQDSSIRKKKGECVLLILDRSIDMKAPLLHEFTYQAMVYDLMEIKTDNKYYSDSKRSKVRSVLNHKDPVWVRYKYLHLMHLNKTLKSELKEFKTDNEGMDIDIRSKEVDVKKVAAVMSKLPNYQKMSKIYDLHLDIAVNIQKQYNSLKLQDLAKQEQNFASGQVMVNGQFKKQDKVDAVSELTSLLSREEIDPNLKMRLLLLYYITRKKGRLKDLNNLFEMAGVHKSDQAPFINFDKFFRKLPKFAGSEKILSHETKKAKGLKGFFKGLGEVLLGSDDHVMGGNVIELSRYTPMVSKIAESIITNKLDERAFPYVKEPKRSFSIKYSKHSLEDKHEAMSKIGAGRTSWGKHASEGKIGGERKKAKWAELLQEQDSESSLKSEKKDEKRHKLFVFVIGGCTYSESRELNELCEKYKVDCCLGGTTVLTPATFMEKMENMYDGDDD